MIKVLGDRVLVALRPEPAERVSDAGLVLVKDPDRLTTPTQGLVMALGERHGTIALADALSIIADDQQNALMSIGELRAELTRLRPAPFDVQVGDCVLFSRTVGEQISDDGVDYVILYESEILGVCEPISREAA